MKFKEYLKKNKIGDYKYIPGVGYRITTNNGNITVDTKEELQEELKKIKKGL